MLDGRHLIEPGSGLSVGPSATRVWVTLLLERVELDSSWSASALCQSLCLVEISGWAIVGLWASQVNLGMI